MSLTTKGLPKTACKHLVVKKGVSMMDLIRVHNHLNLELNKVLRTKKLVPPKLLLYGAERLQKEISAMSIQLEVLRRFRRKK